MASKILIDVGGYHGTSSLAGLDPRFGFDRIFCFEPSSEKQETISRIADSRLVIVRAGLSNRNGHAVLFNAGNLGASIYESAPTAGDEGLGVKKNVALINASDFLDLFTQLDDEVYIKLNCEGCEIDILQSLLNAISFPNIKNVLIDLDALKNPSLAPRVKGVMEYVQLSGLSFFMPEQVQYGMVTNFGGVRNWLIAAGAAERGFFTRLSSLIFNVYVTLRFPECNGYHKMRLLRMFPFLSLFDRSRN